MLWSLWLVQLFPAWLLLRGLAVAMELLYPLGTFVGSPRALFRSGARAPLAPLAIGLASLADSDPEDRAGLVRDDDLGLLGVALLLPARGAPLCFGGRSPGLSATSTPLPANGVPPASHGFLPGQ